MSISIKIPEKHYLGMIKREGDELPLGFLTPWGTDAAAKKRMQTVDNWANHSYRAQVAIPSQIVNNVPLAGFKLADTIRRYAEWGRGNVVWRIEDPRGFELEITNNNLMQIMISTAIVNGEICSPCIWAREGADNILVPVDSQLYINATANTARQSKKVKASEIKPGYIVQLQNGTIGKYLGAYFEVLAINRYEKTIQPSVGSTKKHFVLAKQGATSFIENDENQIVAIATFKVAEILERNEESVEVVEAIIENSICKWKVNDGGWNHNWDIIGFTSDQAVTFSLEKSVVARDVILSSDYKKPTILVVDDDKLGIMNNNRGKITATQIALNSLERCCVDKIYTQHQRNYWGGGGFEREATFTPNIDAEYYQLVCKFYDPKANKERTFGFKV